MFEDVYIAQQYAPLKQCIVNYWFQCPWILKKLGHWPSFNFVRVNLTQ